MDPADMAKFRVIALIVAAGKGLRMQSTLKKQYMVLAGLPVLTRTLKAFDSFPLVDEIVLVLPETDMEFCRDTLVLPFGFKTPIRFVPGGITRQESVFNGLSKIAKISDHHEKTLVLIHDGVRPFVQCSLVETCVERAAFSGACIPALPIFDTVKEVISGDKISKTLDRNLLYRAQTPQVFRLDLVLSAYFLANEKGFLATDEASVLENAGMPVSIVPGSSFNIKLTTQDDLVMARFLLETMGQEDGLSGNDDSASP